MGGRVAGASPFEELLDASGQFKEPEGAADEASVVIYTSGTTGKPKGAVRKFPKEALPAVMRIIAELPMRVDDIHLVVCPLYHATAFAFLTFTHLLGATAVVLDEFKPEPFLEIVQRHGVTTTALVPTMLHRVLALGTETLDRYDTRSLRGIFSLGAPLPGPLAIEAMDRFGDVLFNLYGATELGIVTVAKPADLRAAPATIGPAIPGNEIRLLDDAGNEVRSGEVGELYVRNKMLVAGYHKDDEATRSSMSDGFFSVGDLARRDRDGRYFIEGRKRDMVISGGVNVYPAEVEGVLEQHPALAEVRRRRRRGPGVGRARPRVRRAPPGTRSTKGRSRCGARAARGAEGTARLRLPRRAPTQPDGQGAQARAPRANVAGQSPPQMRDLPGRRYDLVPLRRTEDLLLVERHFLRNRRLAAVAEHLVRRRGGLGHATPPPTRGLGRTCPARTPVLPYSGCGSGHIELFEHGLVEVYCIEFVAPAFFGSLDILVPPL